MVLSAHGQLVFEMGDYERSHELLSKAVHFLEVTQSYRRLAKALSRLSSALEKLGRMEEAEAVKARAAEVRIRLKD